jgi:hypothetical protein
MSHSRLKDYVVSFGRTKRPTTKHLFGSNRQEMIGVANDLAYVLFDEHPFTSSNTQEGLRVERGDFFVEFARSKKLHPV